jgi:S1-C subfamily serine protease
MPARAHVRTLMLFSLFLAVVSRQSVAQGKAPKLAPPVAAPAPVAVPNEALLTVTAAVVMADMSLRPLPAFALEMVNETDTIRRISLRTSLNGTVSQTIATGRYTLRSVTPAIISDTSYRWAISIVHGPNGSAIELTNANSTALPVPRLAVRQVAPEREVFERIRRGVFRVESGLGHGSGFFARIPGVDVALVVTNDHVVANETTASIYLDSVTRVPAVVVARDRDADIAILRIPATRCGDCPRLVLATPKSGEALVVAGERVFAVGFPLNQEMTLTTGVASSVREGAIISDVNINHGNSGGPMLNLAGEVVGINAFGDFTNQGGPGISGAIAITRIEKLLSQVPSALAGAPAPLDKLLPYAPRTAYPVAALKQAADSVDPKAYRKLFRRDADHFTLTITTPVVYRVQQRIFENEVGEERKKREVAASVSKDEAYSETKQSRDWEQYVGNSNTPVVTIAVAPKIGETGASSFFRTLSAMGGTAGQASLVFDSDVRGARFYRNGVEVEPIFGGHGPIVQNVEDRFVKLKDVADYGYYVLPPELFRPDSTGAPARIRVAIQDLKRPAETSGTEIEGEASARVWNDFRAYYQAVHPEMVFIPANSRMRSPRIQMECDSGSCRVAP